MELRLDLHVHSERSPDGRMRPEEIVSLARARGLHGIAIADHDRVMEKIPEYDDFLVIPATEASTERGHLLGLFVTEKIETKDFSAAAAAIRAQGGLAVIAHPFEHSTEEGRLDDVMEHLDGVEVWNGRAERKNRRANAMALALAERWGKIVTAGSDAHLAQEIGNGITVLEADALTPEAVKAALMRGAKRIEGRRGKALFVAKSQYTKRRKTGAGAAKYLKWGAFATKCALEDCIHKEEKWYVFDREDR